MNDTYNTSLLTDQSPIDLPNQSPIESSNNEIDARAKRKKYIIIGIVIFAIIIILVIIVVIIGVNTANHMKQVQNEARMIRDDQLAKYNTKLANTPDTLSDYQKTSEKNQKELDKLNQQQNDANKERENEQKKMFEENAATSNLPVVVAPTRKEKYTFDPQFNISFITGIRGFNINGK